MRLVPTGEPAAPGASVVGVPFDFLSDGSCAYSLVTRFWISMLSGTGASTFAAPEEEAPADGEGPLVEEPAVADPEGEVVWASAGVAMARMPIAEAAKVSFIGGFLGAFRGRFCKALSLILKRQREGAGSRPVSERVNGVVNGKQMRDGNPAAAAAFT